MNFVGYYDIIYQMEDKDKTQVTQVIANGILNSLNINGILEAAKAYSMNMAQERVSVMSEEELSETLVKINAAVEDSQKQQTPSSEEVESTENTEEAVASS